MRQKCFTGTEEISQGLIADSTRTLDVVVCWAFDVAIAYNRFFISLLGCLFFTR
jgi:hypothetical protein